MTAQHIKLEDIIVASHVLKDVVQHTPLQKNFILSEKYGCNVYLKREDLQVVRSFKIRGAYNMIRSLPEEKLQKGVVCASAGNHAQGVAYSCKALQIPGKIFMPTTTPRQKISQVKLFGGPFVEVLLIGDTFDDSLREALAYCDREDMSFIHPFDDPKVVAGQGTIGLELMNDMREQADYVFAGIGGGGLIAGLGLYIKSISPATQVIGVEATGAPSMRQSIDTGEIVTLGEIDKFVDGTAVKRVGEINFDIAREVVDDIVVVPEGKVCTTILELYNENAIIAEPAGALPVAALEFYREQIAGKNVVCVISGGNNDIDRMQEIKERSLIYEGLKHYFIVNFPQRAGALREFLEYVLGPNDDITRFEYTKKTSKENGPALVGIELKHKEDYGPLIERMKQRGLGFSEINKDPNLFSLLI
ncbi:MULTISPECIES: threonine ammonia-lyase IlvA [Paenibacillus]|uniref:L-threonine dehydratase n=1 Tax=Paenibacillus naphthalenovorans TaxID=162209 RepID=A0A0U2WDK1_9BACL|nr:MULTISPECIES: threonine ammonia-lyase IlvA [Paenibacillus]ALS23418.1 threonine dehydratase [Paenibacillus naphthalenovorans]NTZ17056.1 threonine dehydratase [Paenibacillus sp. JMULE4]GCL72890.1 threonine dehydratase [Paenibacillus naphthalenovorans]SDJ26698.1 L-threonine ammonia-lyase [Paenibacillus naphthalenovorans]